MTAVATAERLVLGLGCTVGGRPDAPGVRPLLLLHGAGGSARQWDWFAHGLPAGVVPAAVDLPGHGRSSGVPRSLDVIAERVAAVLGALTGGRPAAVAAHSLGGLVALRLALCWPDLVSHLVLIGTAARIQLHPELVRQLAAAEPDAGFFRGAFSPRMPADRGDVVLDDVRRVRLAEPGDLLGAAGTDLAAELPGVRVPTLVVVARGDRVVSPRRSRGLAAGVSGARLAVLDGGHYLHVERPDEVRSLVMELLRSTPAGVGARTAEGEGSW